MNDVKVYASPLPFSNAQITAHQLPGSSLQEIVDNLIPDHIKHAGIGAIVQINGETIPQEHWAKLRPKQGTLVNVRVVPQGGGGKKNPITALLSIAVLIAAPYIAGAVLGSTLAATQIGIGTLTYGGLLSSAIGVVGRLAISALAPPPKPSNAGFDRVSNPAESPTQFIEGARNSLNPYGVVPINLGTNRIFPLQAASPYTETQNNDQFVRQLFTYGYSNKTIISQLKIGDTALDQFKEFDIENKLEGDLHEGTNLYTNDVFQEDLSIVLNQADGFSTRTTAQNADEAIIDITFPQGLAVFNDQGKRNARRVTLEAQYALSGTSPQDWTPAFAEYKNFSGASFTVTPVTTRSYNGNITNATRTDVVVVNKYSGRISVVQGQNGYQQAQPIPSGSIRLASVNVMTTRENNGTLTTSFTITDQRSSSLFGATLEDSSSFVPSKTNSTQFAISAGAILINDLDINGNTAEALRRSVRVVFPERGQYDIRVRRITGNSSSDQVLDDSAWTAIKSVTYESPVNLENITGTAMRIKATDQLNGALDQFNVIGENVILDYDPDLDDWVERITSNPASLYRHVLQGPANEKPLADSRINIDDLEAWHQHCVEQGYTYNRNIDYETSVDEILRDIAAAGAASPAVVDGKRTVVVDKVKDDIVQIITPRNSWGYAGEMIYPEIPHAFRVQFRNKDKGYLQDERIVYDDGYDETNATLFEVLELQSCTNADLAFKTARRHLASIRLRPETHTFMMDVENLVALRGDRIKLEHDVPLVGIGDARIKTVETSGDSPDTVTAITLDDTITIPQSGDYYVRIRLADGTQIYKEVITNTIGEYTRFDFAVPFDVADAPAVGDLLYCVEAGGELDLIITRIEPQDDLTARITAINYAPEIFTAESAPIPAFDSKVTTPIEFIRPLAPLLLNEQSDESVMLLNSDGSFTPRAVFTLENRNEGTIETKVRVRASGTDNFTNANVLEATPERLVITGLEDGTRYDIHIRYRRAGTNTYSKPLELNSYLFIGASGLPDNVSGFAINVVNDVAFFKWDENDDIDLSHYKIKYSNVYTGASWATAQTLENIILETKYTAPFLGGTYLIKAVDLSGNESETATAIITYNPGTVANAIAVVTESPDFTGVTEGVLSENNSIVLSDPDITTGYYYFADGVDLTGVFPCFVSARVVANGAFINDLYDESDIFAMGDVFGQGENDVFGIDDLFTNDDVFGIGADGWAVELQYRTTETDPNSSPVTWSDWTPLEAGTIEFWAIEFRIKLESLQQNVSPQVTELAVTVDMPDRIERGDDLDVPAAGATVTFTPAFKEIPAVAITIQDGAVDDKIEFTSKTAGEFSFKVYNETAGDYVARTFDYIASGYGRKNT